MKVRSHHRGRPRFAEPELPPSAWTIRLGDTVSRISVAIWLPAIVFVVPLLYYWPSLQVGFVSDDFFYHVTFTYTLRDFIEKLSLIHEGMLRFPYFRPMALASFQLDYLLSGADPVGFHLTNLILHSVNAVLLFFFLRTAGITRLGAVAGALFFGLYPAGPEAVTWVSGRFDLLSMTFLWITLLTWCAARLRNDVRWMIPSLIAFLFAILSKETAAAGFLLLPLVDWMLHARTRNEWGPPSGGVGWHWKWYIVFFALVIAIIAFRIWLYRDIGGYVTAHNTTAYLAVQPADVWQNLVTGDLWMLITPISRILWPDWTIGWRIAVITAGVILGLALIESAIWASVRALKIESAPLARIAGGAIWVIVMLIPVATVAGVKESLDYSRFLYPAVAGLAIWVGVTADMGAQYGRLWQRVTVILLVAILLVSGFGLRRYNETWLEAGEIAGRIHALMATHSSHIPYNTTLFVINYPWLWKGAHCAPIDYNGYIEFRYGIAGIETQYVTKDPDEVDAWWRDISNGWNRPGIGFMWDDSAGMVRLLEPFGAEELSEEHLLEFLGGDVTETNEVEAVPEVEVTPEIPE